MASHNSFSHTDSLRRDPFARLASFGYGSLTSKGENIAADNGLALAVFWQWRNSLEHNQNMLNSNYRVIGVGRAYGMLSSCKYYWTTDFGGYVDQVMLGVTASASPTPLPTPIPTPTSTPKPTPTPVPASTPKPTPTPAPTPTPKPASTPTPAPTPTPGPAQLLASVPDAKRIRVTAFTELLRKLEFSRQRQASNNAESQNS